MKILVAYFSRDGHCKHVAEMLQADLKKCDSAHEITIAEIKETVSRKGFFGSIGASYATLTRQLPDLEDFKHNVSAFDLVVLGTPVWYWTLTPAMRSFLDIYADQIAKSVAFYACQGGSGAERAFSTMARMLQKETKNIETLTVSQPQYDDGEKLAVLVGKFAGRLAAPGASSGGGMESPRKKRRSE